MQTISFGSMFGADEVNIHVLDKSEQGQETHRFVLVSGQHVLTKPLNIMKMEEFCLKVVAEKRAKHRNHIKNPVYLDVIVDRDDNMGIQVIGMIATGKNRVKRIMLAIDI